MYKKYLAFVYIFFVICRVFPNNNGNVSSIWIGSISTNSIWYWYGDICTVWNPKITNMKSIKFTHFYNFLTTNKQSKWVNFIYFTLEIFRAKTVLIPLIHKISKSYKQKSPIFTKIFLSYTNFLWIIFKLVNVKLNLMSNWYVL